MDFTFIKNKMPWITRAGLLLFIGIFLVILSNTLGSSKVDEKKVDISSKTAQETNTLHNMEKDIALRLQSTLEEIDGVGTVKVSVFLAKGPKFNYAVNSTSTRRTIEEKDKTGSNRTTLEQNANAELVLQKEGTASSENPVLLNEEQSIVKGVIVVAEGAASSYIKRDITQLVATLLNIPEYKVSVEPRKGGMFVGSDKR